MTQPCFCVTASELADEEDDAESVVRINQSYQDHVDAIRSRLACYMLSDTEYSDFHESDEDEEWAEYQQEFQNYTNSSRSSKEPAQTDIHIVTDKEKSDIEEQGVEALLSQRPADVFQFESDAKDDSPDLPPFTPEQLNQM